MNHFQDYTVPCRSRINLYKRPRTQILSLPPLPKQEIKHNTVPGLSECPKVNSYSKKVGGCEQR